MTKTKRKRQKDGDAYARPTPEARRHAVYVANEIIERKDGTREIVNVRSLAVLERMRRRSEISERQYLAIGQFMTDMETGQLMKSTICAYQMPVDGGGGPGEWSDRQIAAHQRYVAALRVIGDRAARVLERAFRAETPTAEIRLFEGHDYKTQGRQSTAIMTAIRIYADLLAGHYRIG